MRQNSQSQNLVRSPRNASSTNSISSAGEVTGDVGGFTWATTFARSEKLLAVFCKVPLQEYAPQQNSLLLIADPSASGASDCHFQWLKPNHSALTNAVMLPQSRKPESPCPNPAPTKTNLTTPPPPGITIEGIVLRIVLSALSRREMGVLGLSTPRPKEVNSLTVAGI